MIGFQTSDFKKGRSSCWVSMFVCLCAHVWRPYVCGLCPNHLLFMYVSVTKARTVEVVRGMCVDVSARYVFTPLFSLRCSYVRRAISTNETSRLPETAALLTALCQRFVPTRLFFFSFCFHSLNKQLDCFPVFFHVLSHPYYVSLNYTQCQFKLLTLPSQKSVSVQTSKQFNKMIITAVEVQSNKGNVIKY